MSIFTEQEKKGSLVVLVGIYNTKQPQEKTSEYLDELALLADTAGFIVRQRYLQKVEVPNPRTFIGSGKVTEIATWAKAEEINIVIFDDDLTPAQHKNIEKELNCKVLDRTGLILRIFSERARTSQAKTQVELAHLQYLLPRLTGLWTHLERQRGGHGTRGGAGEKEIETDRRYIRNRIAHLRQELIRIDRQSQTRRQHRHNITRISLVGYTNAGKSSLMNALCKTDIFAEDKLFATLDTTTRKITYNDTTYTLSDTVGFIRKLPHNLIECFKSTLDEVREADILLHVIDVTHPAHLEHLDVVQKTLVEINAADKPTILVFNKSDKLAEPETLWFEQSWVAKKNSPCLLVSAIQRTNLLQLHQLIVDEIHHLKETIHVGYS